MASVVISPNVRMLPNRLYLDTNILFAFVFKNHRKHTVVSKFILDAVACKKELCLSILTYDELWHVSLRELYKTDTGNNDFDPKNPAHISTYFPKVEVLTNNIQQLSNFKLLNDSDGAGTVKEAFNFMKLYSFASRDSFHLANTVKNNIKVFVTSDRDFDKLANEQLDLLIIKL